jgi:hypothetical protein
MDIYSSLNLFFDLSNKFNVDISNIDDFLSKIPKNLLDVLDIYLKTGKVDGNNINGGNLKEININGNKWGIFISQDRAFLSTKIGIGIYKENKENYTYLTIWPFRQDLVETTYNNQPLVKFIEENNDKRNVKSFNLYFDTPKSFKEYDYLERMNHKEELYKSLYNIDFCFQANSKSILSGNNTESMGGDKVIEDKLLFSKKLKYQEILDYIQNDCNKNPFDRINIKIK